MRHRSRRRRVWKLPELWTHRTRPPLLAKPQNGFAQAPTRLIVVSLSEERKIRTSPFAAVNDPQILRRRPFPFKRQPGVNPKQIRALADLEFVAKAENLVFIGHTGVGKTGLASGLLLKAIQNGYRGRFIRAQDLFDEMYASLADRSTRRLLNTLIRIDVLHIDELGYLNLKPEQTNIFFKLMEERYRRKPTIITTNLDHPEWQAFLGNKALVEALRSRLRHQCHTIRIDGPSLRDPQG